MKNFLSKLGWMFLLPTFMAYDKQKHGAVAIVATIPTFYIPMNVELGVMWSSIISIALVSILAWGYEFYQKYTNTGVFDIFYALIMNLVNIILLLFLGARALQVGYAL